MITSFTVENFRSIDERIELSMEASAAIKDMEGRGYTSMGSHRVLNAMAFFGANSSGKTNVFKAIGRMRNLIIQSVRLNDGEVLDYDPFLLSDSTPRPTRFEISFIDGVDRFVYGFSYSQDRIEEEWLEQKSPRRSWKTLLNRSRTGIIIDDQYFSEGSSIHTGGIPLNDNRLFISLAAQLGGEISKRVIEWFRTQLNVISGLRDNRFSGVTKEMIHSNSEYRDDIIKLIGSMDLGFNEVKTEQENLNEMTLPKGLPPELVVSLRGQLFITAYSKHMKYDSDGNVVGIAEFDIDERESDGTKKLFSLAGPIVDTLRKGKTLFIDELDAQLHPLLARRIVDIFNNYQTNPNGAQLIFTSHDTNLLSNKLLRRDQIIFVKKDQYAKTHLTPMMSIKMENGAKPRTDSNYEKNYLEGRYEAIPSFQGLIDLIDV